jgi:hypothetical protein
MITLFVGLTILFSIFMWALGIVVGGLLPEKEDYCYNYKWDNCNYNEYKDIDINKVIKNINKKYYNKPKEY